MRSISSKTILTVNLPRTSSHFPNDDPEGGNVALDGDEDLAWPDPERLGRWWEGNHHRFSAGTTYSEVRLKSRPTGMRRLPIAPTPTMHRCTRTRAAPTGEPYVRGPCSRPSPTGASEPIAPIKLAIDGQQSYSNGDSTNYAKRRTINCRIWPTIRCIRCRRRTCPPRYGGG